MKKSIKSKDQSTTREVKPDIVELINKMQETLAGLERKIDAFIGQAFQRAVEVKPLPRPAQPVHQPHQQTERKPESNQRERILHKAICADCHKECEVPFKPSGDRPVYCKECFGLRKTWNPAKSKQNNAPAVSATAPVRVNEVQAPPVIEKKKTVEKKKVADKKKPAAKKRKDRR